MTRLRLTLAIAMFAAAIGLSAQQPNVHEKLYVSLEATDDIAVIDTATNKIIKRITVGAHPHGQASPRSQDRLYVATEVGGTVALVDTVKDTLIKVFDVGFGTEPQNGAITPDGRFLYQPSYAGYYQVFDTQKEEIIEYIHTLGIGHNTVMDPEGRFAYLLPIAGGPGHWKRPSLGLPRTQPKEVTVVDAKTHKVVGTIPTGTGPRPGTISPDGRRVYMNVDNLLGFLVIDTAARKVVSKAEYMLTKDEQAVASRSHGIAVANDGKEVWSNDVVHNLTFVFDVTGSQPKQIARFEVGRQPYWIMPTKDSKTVYVACPSSDEIIVFDVVAKKEKARIQFPERSRPTRMLTVAAPRSAATTSSSR